MIIRSSTASKRSPDQQASHLNAKAALPPGCQLPALIVSTSGFPIRLYQICTVVRCSDVYPWEEIRISDTPAWIVSAANTYAIENGKTPFSVYQGKWCLADRSFERDIIPMAQHFGMALAPWGVLGGGMYQTKKALEERKKKGESLRGGGGNFSKQSEADIRVSEALAMVSSFFFLFSPIYTFANFDSPMIKVAEQHGIESVTAIALAYVIAKAPKVFPIVGGRKIEHLKDNIRLSASS